MHLVVGSAPLDLMRREADLAVRLFREKTPALLTRKIWGHRVRLVMDALTALFERERKMLEGAA